MYYTPRWKHPCLGHCHFALIWMQSIHCCVQTLAEIAFVCSRWDLCLALQLQQLHCFWNMGEMFFFPTCLYSLLLIVRHNYDFSLNKGRPKHRHCVWDFWSRFPNAYGDLKGGIRCDQPVLMGTVAQKASVAHLHGLNCPHKYVFKYFHSTQIFCIRLCPVYLLPETCHLLSARAWAMLWDALQ